MIRSELAGSVCLFRFPGQKGLLLSAIVARRTY